MEILSDIQHGIATLVLNRPAALNSLSLAMVHELDATLRGWACDSKIKAVVIRGAGEKAFCAGGDVRALYESFTTGGDLHSQFFPDEYRLDYLIHRYPKPCVALIDGICMGGGMGIAQAASFRIVTDRTRIAMPEVGIGLIPDVGASFFLSRLPGALGFYLALTGNQIRAADAIYVGLADLYLPVESVAHIEEALCKVTWSGKPLADVKHSLHLLGSTQLQEAPLSAVRTAIDRNLMHEDAQLILEALGNETDSQYTPWAQQTLATISQRSPITVAVALRQLQRGRAMTLAQCLRMELGLVQHCFERGDFIEGVRALIIEKDNTPHWRQASLEAVLPGDVEAFFADPWADQVHPLAGLECGSPA